MELTKFTHSCVRLDDGDRTLVLDPGSFSELDEALDGADAVFVTHEHIDHLEPDRLRTALSADSRLRLYAPAPVAEMFGEFGEQVETVETGQSYEVAGFPVRTFGGQHAVIHPTIPVIANVAAFVADTVYHPGDSLIVPPVDVPVLLAPMHAPWSKTSEVIDFVVGVRAPKVTGIHDALLIPPGLAMVEGHVGRLGGEHGSEFVHLSPRETLTV
ncbi:MBL fold metallo-hydrolase [uncultured Jatrophihabitans sp.]|uniref:MBL fold metallo-hydrolase n=1 Tax=uncultured Jatrophihabitans sp. TaxID=1610747 RepID=UPI0035C9A347